MNNRKMIFVLSIYYSLVFMSNGAFSSYIGLYYAGIHLNNVEIGVLTTVSAIIALVGQPFWGIRSDRARFKNHILLTCLLLSALSIWLVPLAGKVLWLLILCSSVFYFFQCAINPLSDAMTLELTSKGKVRFSMVRTVGSLGFAIMSALAGWIFDKHLNDIFLVFSCMMLLSFLFSILIPKVEGHQRGKNRVKLMQIFQNKKLLWIYLYAFIIESTLGFFFAFHAIYSKQQGISTGLIGIGIMIGSFSQFPFMIFFDKLYQKFGILKILLFSGVIHAIRWGLYAFALTPTMLIITWALHGGTFMLFYLCLAEYVSKHVVKELRASGQMMNSLITSGASRIAGGLLGGVCTSLMGMRATWTMMAVVCLAAVVAFLLLAANTEIFKERPDIFQAPGAGA